jgi:RNA polymerase sigma-70 factor (ECF subfamily)
MAVVARTIRAHRGFEGMYRRHVASIYRYTLAVLGNEADAEDATQQTFLSAYRSWERGERPRRTHNWLIVIAHNVCRQRFRERSRRPTEVELVAGALPAPEDDQLLGAAELRSALEQLAFNQRAALVMRELGGIPYREIAASLGVSEGAVETLLFRARRALREQLEGDLTCGEAEVALSRRLDGMLPHSEAAGLRAHLRACPECATLARSMSARRAALRGLAFPLPPTLTWASGPSAVGTGLLAKGAAVVAVGALAAGVGTKELDRARPDQPAVAAPATSPARGAASRARIVHARRRDTAPARSPHALRPVRPKAATQVKAPHTERAARPSVPSEVAETAAAPVAAPVAAAASADPVATPVAATAAGAAEVVQPVLILRSRLLKPLVDSPSIETAAVVATLETIASAVAPPALPTAPAPAALPAAVPAVSVPAVSVPAVTVPAVTVPAVTVPAVTVPSLPLPSPPTLTVNVKKLTP